MLIYIFLKKQLDKFNSSMHLGSVTRAVASRCVLLVVLLKFFDILFKIDEKFVQFDSFLILFFFRSLSIYDFGQSRLKSYRENEREREYDRKK